MIGIGAFEGCKARGAERLGPSCPSPLPLPGDSERLHAKGNDSESGVKATLETAQPMKPPLVTNQALPTPDGSAGPSSSTRAHCSVPHRGSQMGAHPSEGLGLPGPEEGLETEQEQGLLPRRAVTPPSGETQASDCSGFWPIKCQFSSQESDRGPGKGDIAGRR